MCKGCPKVLKGAIGIVKAVTHLDRAMEDTIKFRLAVCGVCPEASKNEHHEPHVCNACRCWLEYKTAVKTESCPRGYWAAERKSDVKSV